MLTASEDEDDLFTAIKAGARGYLLKDLEAPQLRAMLEAVGRGEAAISPATAARILAGGRPADEQVRARSRQRRAAEPDRLTEREVEVLRLVVAGLRNKEIAADLGISENTAKFHLRNILEKLHAGSRTEVAARAVREGLVPERADRTPVAALRGAGRPSGPGRMAPCLPTRRTGAPARPVERGARACRGAHARAR